MPNYQPKTEEQIAKEGLLPEAIYEAEIIESEAKTSKSGNEMIALKVKVFDEEGGQHIVFDYIVFGNNFGERKFRHAAVACNLLDKYTAGKLEADDFVNTMCRVEVKQQKGTTEYPNPKNIIFDYIERDQDLQAIKKQVAPKKSDEDLNDGIPF